MSGTISDTMRPVFIADFFQEEYAHLVRFVRRLIADTAVRDGEDIVQDVALNLFAQADVTGPIEDLAAYVYRALRNRVVDELRKRKEEPISLETKVSPDSELTLADVLRDARYDAMAAMKQQELSQRIFKAIDALSPSQQAVIIETEFEGRSFRELSESWGVPVGTLLARKSRGLQAIRAALEEEHI